MNFKKIIIKCFLIISLVGILISCGSDTDIVTPDLNSSEENSNQEKNIAPKLLTEKQSDDSGNKDRGGVLKRLWADPATLDPHLVTDTTSAGLVVELFSGLVSLNSDLEIVPELAESWDISDDGIIYTFNLRDDIKFSNGDKVTASDFKWSIERAANPDTGSMNAEVYLGDIVGVTEVIEAGGSLTEVS